MGLFSKKKQTTKFYAICQGEVKDITQACDEVFSQKMMGDGVMVIPQEGVILSPSDGEITMVFPTKHAMGLKLEDGTEILLHFGIDTVNLNGEGFHVCVNQGDKVKTGDKLWQADLEFIRSHAPSEAMMIVITTLPQGKQIQKQLGMKKTGEMFLEIQ